MKEIILFRKKIMVMAAFVLSVALLNTACSKSTHYPEPAVKGAEITIDADKIKPGKPGFFTFRQHDKGINFFVVRIDDRMLSFLDSCAKCYASSLGYVYENGSLRCRKCNVKYSMSEIEKGIGSCYPIKIPGRLQDGKYIIDISTLQNLSAKF